MCLTPVIMMPTLWQFLRQRPNREILGWLGGGLVILATAIWTVAVYLWPPKPGDAHRGRAAVEANCGSLAIAGSVSGSTIVAGTVQKSDCSNKPK
jgi:hypothetical protein